MNDKILTKWPALPELQSIVFDLPEWPYPMADGNPTLVGYASLRLFSSSDGGHVAIVEDCLSRQGRSVTNGAEHIWASLCEDFPDGPITQIELYRCGRDGGPGIHFDQYMRDPEWKTQLWRRLSDIGPEDPDHDEVTAWTTANWNTIIKAGD